MNNKGQLDSKQLQMQAIMENHLQTNSRSGNLTSEKDHLDEDSLTAFVEGSVNDRESKSIVSHLAGCSYCRHISAELVKLDIAVADVPQPIVGVSNEPAKISEVLSGVLSRIFGAADGAVFAHNEEESEEDKSAEDSDNSDDSE